MKLLFLFLPFFVCVFHHRSVTTMATEFLRLLQTNPKAQLATFEIIVSLLDGIPPASAEKKDVDKANEYLKGGEYEEEIGGEQNVLTTSRLKNILIMMVSFSSMNYIAWSVYLYDLYNHNDKSKNNKNDNNTSLLSLSRIEKVGLGINLCGILLRTWSKLTLANLFTYTVAIQDDHRLIKSGPYSILRHPSYTGLLLQTYGNAIFFRNWYSSVFAYYFSYVFIGKRIPFEEEILSKHYKEEWEQYKKQTWKLFPFIY